MKTFRNVTLFICLFSLLALPTSEAADDINQRVLVVRVKGDVTVGGTSVDIGDSIKIGETIIAAGKKSYIQFQFASGTLIMLRDGILKVSKIKTKSTVIDLVKGVIFSFVKKQNGNKVKIRTSSASMGVRGTKFIAMAKPNSTYLCVCKGVVNIKNKTGNIDIRANEDITVSLKGKMSKAKANLQMWDMSKEGFGLMGMEIPDIN